MLMLATEDIGNCLVSFSNGRVVDYMREHGIEKIVKGYRNDTDLEYERVQAEYNLKHGGYETELWRASDSLSGVSSTLARERISSGEELSGILPDCVADYINGNSPIGELY
jgi:pantetheine-phosphate adenylyltransferase